MVKRAVIVSDTEFPYGSAYSSRLRNIVDLFVEIGYFVHIIAGSSRESNYDFKQKISITYIEKCNHITSKFGISKQKTYIDAIKSQIKISKPNIIISSSMVFQSEKIHKIAKANNIPYIVEQCEWFDSSTFKGRRFNPYYRKHIKMIQTGNRKYDGIIAISRLFEAHYKSQNIPALRIPTILDLDKIEPREKKESKDINITFAGSLGKGKELFEVVFQAITVMNWTACNRKFVLNIYGPDELQILNNIQGNTTLFNQVKPYIKIHGRIPQQEVEGKIREADYSIFVRPERRSSNAGFPTKFAESMAVGTPVITNNTGDIKLYLEDGINGFLLKENTPKKLAEIFVKILNMRDVQASTLRKNARKTAEDYFDYRSYKEKMLNFIAKVTTEMDNSQQ